MADETKIFGIAGSLREGSFNRSLLRAAAELAPDGMRIDIFDRLGEIPGFNQDEETQAPDAVVDMKRRIRAADGVLIVTPEYNYSIPGVLKNAIDWASRPFGDNSWQGKPVAVMGASISLLGTARAQYHLRQCFVFLDMHAVNLPEVMVASAQNSFDESGQLTNDTTKDLIRTLLGNLAADARATQGRLRRAA
jgi:chromate reductase